MLRVGRGRRGSPVGRLAGAGLVPEPEQADPVTAEAAVPVVLVVGRCLGPGDGQFQFDEADQEAEPEVRAVGVVPGVGADAGAEQRVAEVVGGQLEAEVTVDPRTDALEQRQRDDADAVADPESVLTVAVHLDVAPVEEDAGLAVLRLAEEHAPQGQLVVDGVADRGGSVRFGSETVLDAAAADDEAGAGKELFLMLLTLDHGGRCPFWTWMVQDGYRSTGCCSRFRMAFGPRVSQIVLRRQQAEG